MNEELENLQNLQDELLSQLYNLLQSGINISDEVKLLVANQLEWLVARIEELSSQNPVDGMQPPSSVPQLDEGPYPSSNINSFKYDPNTKKLFVKFHGKDSADSGPIYGYENVPKNIYDVFSRGGVAPRTSGKNRYHTWIRGVTPSLGASLYALIREGGYPYQKIS